MIDLDQFKRYNDLHGHPTGDECLRQVTALLAGGLRRADEMLARYGGEELAAVVPETSEEDLRLLAETLRRRVAAARIQHGDSTVADHVTVSIGGAVTRPAAWDSLERLVAAADAALYRAKAAGRDRVETVDLGVSKEVDIV
jgi:diguanylate cyclase (GGDEF)-like protein